jgi:hypothetical protein
MPRSSREARRDGSVSSATRTSRPHTVRLKTRSNSIRWFWVVSLPSGCTRSFRALTHRIASHFVRTERLNGGILGGRSLVADNSNECNPINIRALKIAPPEPRYGNYNSASSSSMPSMAAGQSAASMYCQTSPHGSVSSLSLSLSLSRLVARRQGLPRTSRLVADRCQCRRA